MTLCRAQQMCTLSLPTTRHRIMRQAIVTALTLLCSAPLLAEVPPAEIPEPVPAPPWLPALLVGIGILIIVAIVVVTKRRRT